MNLPITSFIYSVEDRAFLLEKLAELEKAVFTTEKPFEKHVQDELSFSVSQALLVQAQQANVSFNSPESIKNFLSEQEAMVRALPIVGIRVAVPLSYDTVKSISKWFDSNLEKKVLVELKVDSGLLGGATIEWNGKYMDYSLKKLLNEKLKPHMQKGKQAVA